MTGNEIKQAIWRNTLSNYVCVGVRLITGVILFRLLYQALSTEEFGFWALLWTLFGYGILLDFGFGFTAQKRVAELLVHHDWERLSRVLSTIFFSYLGIAVAFILVGLFGAGAILSVFQVTAENEPRFREVLALFLCGVGVAFPMGLFPEILRGQQRISLANYIFCAGMLVQFVLTAVAIRFNLGLKVLIVIALVCTFIPDLICGWFALRQMPLVQLRPKFFSRKMVFETMSFSVYAYLITISGVILTKTDQLLISSVLAVSAVALYQAGAKVAEMFAGLVHQLPDTFSPAAAHLHAKGSRGRLQRLLVDGTRFSVMVATPFYLICAFYMNTLLRLLTGEPVPAPETYWVAQVLLVWGYTLVVTQSVSKRVFMMCGHEKRLAALSTGEAALNLVVSLGLILWSKSIVGAAIGSLIASSLFGWCFLWPWAAKEAALTGLKLARVVLLPTWIACSPVIALMLFAYWLPSFSIEQNVFTFFAGSLLVGLLAAAGLWRIALTAPERTQALQYLQKLRQRTV